MYSQRDIVLNKNIIIKRFGKVSNKIFEQIKESIGMIIDWLMGRAISDLQKACDMGDELGCKNLQRALEKR